MRVKVNLVSALLGCAVAMAAMPAAAVFTSDFQWIFNIPSSNGGSGNCLGSSSGACAGQNAFGNIRSPSSSTGPAMTAQAWADTGMPSNPNDSTLATAYLAGWGGNGLGVQNRDLTQLNGGSPPSSITSQLAGGGDVLEGDPSEHSMDGNEKFDAIVIRSAEAVTLTGLKIGWSNTDSDIFLLAYTKSGAPPATAPLGGTGTSTYKELADPKSGWTLVSNYPNLVVGDITPVNGGSSPVSANYWLIGAYTKDFGSTGCIVGSYNKCDDGKDTYVKLLAAYGDKPPGNKVPEPNALLLVGVALAGVWATRRRARTD